MSTIPIAHGRDVGEVSLTGPQPLQAFYDLEKGCTMATTLLAPDGPGTTFVRRSCSKLVVNQADWDRERVR